MTRRQMLTLWVLAFTWGASFLFIKIGVRTIPPLTFVLLRAGIAALILWVVMRSKGLRLPTERRLLGGLLFIGFINAALPYTLFAWGELHIGENASGLASIYNASTPLWTVVFATLFVQAERLSWGRTAGVLLGFLGVVFLFSSDLEQIGSLDMWGQIACLVASACYGVGVLFVRRRLQAVPALVAAFGQMFGATLWLAPVALVVDYGHWQMPAWSSIAALLMLAIIGTGIAQIIFFGLVKEVGATRTAQVTYLLPLFALALGWLVEGEPLRMDMFIGLGLILMGVVVVNGRWPVRSKPAPVSVPK